MISTLVPTTSKTYNTTITVARASYATSTLTQILASLMLPYWRLLSVCGNRSLQRLTAGISAFFDRVTLRRSSCCLSGCKRSDPLPAYTGWANTACHVHTDLERVMES